MALISLYIYKNVCVNETVSHTLVSSELRANARDNRANLARERTFVCVPYDLRAEIKERVELRT